MRALTTTALALLTTAGCATSDPELEARLVRVQVYQAADPSLSCTEILAQVEAYDRDIDKLEEELDESNTPTTAPTGGPNAALNSLMTSMYPLALAQQRQYSDKIVRSLESRQQRRDVLMKQYYAKGC